MSIEDHPSVPALSLLDLAQVGPGQSSADALDSLRDHARRADELGLRRFWIAEHHNAPALLGAAPPVLVGAVAAATSRIRVGAGGMLLPHHLPLVLAEVFGTLGALHPGRIDLGLGRSLGADRTAAAALGGRVPSGEEFLASVRELLLRQRGRPADAAAPGCAGSPAPIAVPGDDRPPVPVWVLGSSLDSARRAGQLGLPYAYAHHLTGTGAGPALTAYRRCFTPSAQLAEPRAIVSVTAVCGVDDEHAELLALPAHVGAGAGGRSLPAVADVLARGVSPEKWAEVRSVASGQAVGGPERVASRLEQLWRESGADELLLAGIIADPRDRLASLERVVAAVGGTPATR